MKGNLGLVAVAVVVAALWMSRRPAAAAATTKRPGNLTTPQRESSLSGVRIPLTQEKPPSDVRQHALGPTTYVKFEQPPDVGGGFKQWGVTKEGTPVISMNPPESYDAWEWF